MSPIAVRVASPSVVQPRIEVLAEALVEVGVRALFGIPGSGLSLQLITALERHSVPFYDTCHEASAAMMAGAFAQQTGSLGCAMSVKGPGLANLLPGIVCNAYEHDPVLTISEAYGPSGPAGRMHKRLDQEHATAWCVKAYATLGASGDVVSRLAAQAREEIPGPVHLDLVTEGTAQWVEYDGPTRPGHAVPDGRQVIRQLINAAQRPVVITGSLARRRSWGRRLSGLRLPVFTTLAAKGVVDEAQPWAAGVFTGDGQAQSPEAVIVPSADLIIGLGLRALEVLTPRPFRVRTVLLDAVGSPGLEGVGEAVRWTNAADEDVEAVLSALSVKTWGEALVERAVSTLSCALVEEAWLPGRCLAHLQGALPSSSCLVADAGFFCTVAEHLWQSRTPGAFVASANGRFMGTGLPMAIGTALANRERPVVCALGDGGIKAYVADLKLLIAERLPMLLVLFSDGRYGSVAGVPAAQGLSQQATTIRQPSWYAAVAALGCPADRVTTFEEFAAAVARWDWSRGPRFIEAVFDPERYAGMLDGIR